MVTNIIQIKLFIYFQQRYSSKFVTLLIEKYLKKRL